MTSECFDGCFFFSSHWITDSKTRVHDSKKKGHVLGFWVITELGHNLGPLLTYTGISSPSVRRRPCRCFTRNTCYFWGPLPVGQVDWVPPAGDGGGYGDNGNYGGGVLWERVCAKGHHRRWRPCWLLNVSKVDLRLMEIKEVLWL